MSTRRAFVFVLAATLTFASNAFPASKPAVPATPDWIVRSNADAQPLLKVFGDFGPEFAARLGVKGYDDRVSSFPLDAPQRFRKAIGDVRDGLKAKLAEEKDPQVQQDLKIMIDAASLPIDTSLLNEKYLLPYTNVGQTIFFGEFNLLQDQVEAKRRPSALTRLKRYTGLEKGYTPVTTQAKAQFEAVMGDKKLLGPFRGQVDQDLANTASYVDGIRKLYAKYKISGADKALDALDAQLKDYDAWIKSTVMPLARDDFRLPPELYADNLKNVGLDIPPDELIAKAELAYAEIRNEMQRDRAARREGARPHRHRLPRRDPRAQEGPDRRSDQIEPTYHDVIGKIEDIIRREHIVTLPERADDHAHRLRGRERRAAGAAHASAAADRQQRRARRVRAAARQPAHRRQRRRATTTSTIRPRSWTLTAHEGRPGHELQFSAMVERGVSLARSLFAFNSVNVEGWALYAEAEMKPYEPLDGQLFALQPRLQRAARAFLDPMLNLGRITPERAKDVLTEEVVLSPAYARAGGRPLHVPRARPGHELFLRLHQADGAARRHRDQRSARSSIARRSTIS